jgi:outer membrane protein OmpA-like peptidoglycan-associated protein
MKRFLTAVLIGLAATSATAAEDDTFWNVGAAASFSQYSFDDDTLDDNSVGLQLFVGYRFNKWFGLEGAYHNTGTFSDDIDPPNPGGDVDVSLDGISGSALVFAPTLAEGVDLYGKVGYYAFDQDLVIDDAVSQNNSPDGLLLGAGARLMVSEQFAVRAEYEWYDIDDGDLWALNLGFEYLFGRPAKAEPVAVAAPPPPPPPPPPPAPKDSDGDGVFDDADQCPGTPAGAKVDARGCEEQLILRGVNFEFGSAKLTPRDEQLLDSVATILAQRERFNVEVRGHTDNIGSEAFNLGLSQRRAESVRDYLISKGVPAERLTAVGKGLSDPIAPNDTEEGRALNRRVTLEFSDRPAAN